ncbi:hypothetical protein EX30DRAFT_341823 [Ascodesmis nigricans]|uniref:Uncharacterized protein n=1 Tax=Ascodesmis nigricans TaxID=341454 RepID=A0A4S2MTV8_9PEZI|nr:hypothetical protein EX30DRAFT_341823 [Ascodesmis nigricans]
MFKFIAALLALTTLTAAVSTPEETSCIQTTACPDGFMINDPCGTAYFQDPCWDYQGSQADGESGGSGGVNGEWMKLTSKESGVRYSATIR